MKRGWILCLGVLLCFIVGLQCWRPVALGEGLFLEAQAGNVPGVEEMLRRGADANFRFDDERTPLAEAVADNNLRMAKVLLDHGADPNLLVNSKSMLRVAKSEEMKELLIRYGAH